MPDPTPPAAPVLPGEEVPTQLPPETLPGAPDLEPPPEPEEREPPARPSALGQRLCVVAWETSVRIGA